VETFNYQILLVCPNQAIAKLYTDLPNCRKATTNLKTNTILIDGTAPEGTALESTALEGTALEGTALEGTALEGLGGPPKYRCIDDFTDQN